ncbi:MAG: inositol monophosphatase, partial [Coxiellaceae bacterium]|nr:inositol monophosphatase [Coxiellaceae bacterium]
MTATTNIAEAAARKAGRIIIRAMENLDDLEITEKSRNDYATEVDRASEKAIIDHILATFPDDKI